MALDPVARPRGMDHFDHGYTLRDQIVTLNFASYPW